MPKIIGDTRRCVRCKREARFWCGYVETKEGKHVLAGWCSKKCSCYHGPYRKWMEKQ